MPPRITSSAFRRFGSICSMGELVTGALLVSLGCFVIWSLSDLEQGSLGAMGPAMLPRWLAVGIIACGLILIVTSFVGKVDWIEDWNYRGPFFVTLAIVFFSVTIREFGLAVAGPIAIVIGGLASNETRLREIIIFSVVMTAFCIVLFRYALNQPMPVLIIPGLIHI